MTQSVTESSQAWILIRGIRIQMRDISMEDIFCPSEAPMTLENSPNQLAPSIFSMQRPRTSQQEYFHLEQQDKCGFSHIFTQKLRKIRVRWVTKWVKHFTQLTAVILHNLTQFNQARSGWVSFSPNSSPRIHSWNGRITLEALWSDDESVICISMSHRDNSDFTLCDLIFPNP